MSSCRPSRRAWALVCALALLGALALAGCGSSSSAGGSTAGGSTDTGGGAPVNGGTLQAGEVSDPDHLDPALSYTTESWEMLEATNNGLVGFSPAAGAAGNRVVPILAKVLPTVSDHGLTYTFHMRTGIRFAPPVNRAVQPSDVKFSIERLFRVNSPGVEYYSEIAGATQYAKTRKGGISGIVADDAKHTISFHLTQPDGTFLEYLAMPFAFAVPKGTPNTDISTDSHWRVGTGPYMISQYVPKDHITIVRNPNFHSWSHNVPAGHLNEIHVTLGVSPDEAVNQIADGQLDFYFEQVAPDRLAELQARYPSQVHNYTRNALVYFSLNMRKPPMNNLKVRQAINYAVSRAALVKIFGGQGTPTENLIPSGLGATASNNFYPYNPAKAKALVTQSHTKGMAVQVWASNTDPQPAAAQYMASVLNSLGYKATVKTLDEGIYYDTVAAQVTNPQVSYNEWDQDFPEADDYIEGLLDGNEITNVGNNNTANFNVPSVNQRIDAIKKLPLGSGRDAQWAALGAQVMRDYAPYVPFMDRAFPKFESARVHGQVFNETFYELFPSMWLSK
ncbi:MAG TPA: ABC transporter substrate-binding protein [Solirubrobacteraceae bacterium]|nr:ABC transporter substrate-binding protein [Solirubrobacteraceae bacterium]